MKEKLKAFGLPSLVVIALLAALYFHQLSTMTKLPNEEWSRSIALDYDGKELPITFQRENELYLTNVDKVNKFVIGEGLSIESYEEIAMDVPRGFPFWTDGENFITLSQGNLTLTGDGGTKVIDEEVSGLATEEENVLYWKNGIVYTYDFNTSETTEIHTFTNEIIDIVFGSDGSYAVVHQRDDANADVFLVDTSGEVNEEAVLSVKNSLYDQLGSLVLNIKDDDLTIIYGRQMRTGGSLSYTMYKATGKISDIGGNPLSVQQLNFFNEESASKLQAPDDATLVTLNGELHLVFTAEGQRIGDNSNMRLYSGKFQGGNQVVARPVNTNNNVAQNPMKANEESLLWISFNGDYYKLFGASQNSQVKAESTELSAEDWKLSGYNSFLMLFSSMVTALTSFYWYLPSLTLLLLLYILRPNIFEKDGINWVEYVAIFIFILMPFTYMNQAMNPYFYEMAPFYYTFNHSGTIILIIISVVAALIWKIGRDPDWGTFAGVFYYLLVYMVLYIFSVGPYIFNLF
ncbi:hypothetical protein [Bacillus sp. SG-1]|uniref:hypothetical protein n=1 Tax=Bacillus sp. SG-1 TaxID=161544 RepID=UPI00015437C1|nr:hypothetical protein [Bacillus sp. SG-1]EDL65846.1 hypothetical protein BSG1_16360 [Bacillus sp. SG-1]